MMSTHKGKDYLHNRDRDQETGNGRESPDTDEETPRDTKRLSQKDCLLGSG